ncbi:MAG: tRNA pseudouridine(38-40) synthase TruA [Chloroflexi bacterium]|nr:tRNA pseudouridine(38-40) synthase TruA [Chloroflexota bacterium]
MARYQIILAYDGAAFEGFQRQANARTVQQTLETALRGLGWSGKALPAAGRTDRGVHAAGQCAAFDLEWKASPGELRAAINAALPADVAVRQAWLARPDFHPRYDALWRRYRYRLYCQPVRNPLMDRCAWRVWPSADLQRMQSAAQLLVGMHDFAAFGRPMHLGGSTVRTVHLAEWREDASGLVFEIQANAFLFRMVRRLVFALAMTGQGRLEGTEIAALLGDPPQRMAQGLAPPQGLTLWEVGYPPQDTPPADGETGEE